MKIRNKGKLRNCILVALFALLMCVAAAFGGTLTGSTTADAATAPSNETAIVLNNGDYSSIGTMYTGSLTRLYMRILNCYSPTTKTYSDVNTSLSSATDKITIAKSTTKDIHAYTVNEIGGSTSNVQVKFGGYTWYVVMVSYASTSEITSTDVSQNGDMVATLMLANYDSGSGTMNFSKHSTAYTSGSTYLSCDYSTSYVRSYLTGSTYASSSSTCTSTVSAYSSTNTTGSKWQVFANTYKSYLVQPKYMYWQAYQYNTLGYANVKANNGFLKYSGTTYTPTGVSNKSWYGSWKEDYVWLPSAEEIGLNGTNATALKGIWKTTAGLRTVGSNCWTRGNEGNSNAVIGNKTDGNYVDTSAVCSNSTSDKALYLRPAIHLNLTKLAARTTNTRVSPVTPAWSSSQNSGITYSSTTQLYGSYTGAEQTATTVSEIFPYYSKNTAATHSTSGTAHTLTASAAGKHYLRFSTSGFFDSSGTAVSIGNVYLYFKIYRALLNFSFDSTNFAYDGSPHAPSITSIWATSGYNTSSSTVTIAAGSSYLPTASQFTISYWGTKSDGTAYASQSSRTATKPTERGTYYMAIQLNSKCKNYANFAVGSNYTDPEEYSSSTGHYVYYTFTIKNPSIAIPTWSDGTTDAKETTYNGSDQTYYTSISTSSLPGGVGYTTSGLVSYSGTTVKVNGAGTNKYIKYYLTNTTDYAWSDGTTSDKYLYITVNKYTIPTSDSAGTASGVEWWNQEGDFSTRNPHFNNTTSGYMAAYSVYTGSQQYAEIRTSYSSYSTYVTLEHNFDSKSSDKFYATNAGRYYVTLTLTNTSNLQWADGTTSAKTLYFHLYRAVLTPTWEYTGTADSSVKTIYAYTGSGKSPNVEKISTNSTSTTATLAVSAVTKKYYGSYRTTTGTSTYSLTTTAPSVVGQYYARLYLTAAQAANYCWSTTYQNAYSYSASTVADTYASSSMYYIYRSYQELTWSTTSTTFTYNGSNQGPYVSSIDTTSIYYGASLGTNSIIVKYTGTTSAGATYSSTNRPTQAGSYTATAQLTTDQSVNYTLNAAYRYYSDTTATNQLRTITKSFTIGKKSIPVPTWEPIDGSQDGGVTRVDGNYAYATYTGSEQYAETEYGYVNEGSYASYVTVTTSLATQDKDGTKSKYRYYATSVNSYQIEFKLPNLSNYEWSDDSTSTYKYLYFVIEKASIAIPYWVTSDDYSISGTTATATYTGSTIKFIAYEHQWASSPTYATGTASGGYSSSDYKRTINATDAGSYTISWTPGGNAKWSDGTTGTKYLYITIKRAVLTVTWNPSGTASYTYTGNAQGPTISKVESTGKSITPTVYYNGTYYTGATTTATWGSNTTQTTKPINAGSYTATARLTDTQAANYTFSSSYASPSTTNSGTTTTKTFTISKKSITVPVWEPVNRQGKGVTSVDGDYAYASYTASEQGSQTVAGYLNDSGNASYVTVTYTDGMSTKTSSNYYYYATDTGKYTITFALKDTANYVWSDASTATNKYLYFVINRAVLTVTWNPSGTATYTYNNELQGPTISSVSSTGKEITPTVYYNGTYYTGAATTATWGSNTTQTTRPTYAGSYTATARLTTTEAKNYTFSSSYADPTKTNSGTTTTKSFTINKASITIPYWVTSDDYSISGTRATATYNGSNIDFKAYEHKWASSASCSPDVEDTDDWDESDCIRHIIAKTAGSYTISWTPSANAKWSDNSTGTKYLYVTINKMTIDLPTWEAVNGGKQEGGVTRVSGSYAYATYTFHQQYAETEAGYVNDGTYADFVTVTYTTGMSIGSSNYRYYATDAKTYTITYKINNTNNCVWSGNTTTNKYLYFVIEKAAVAAPYWDATQGEITVSGTTAKQTFDAGDYDCAYGYYNYFLKWTTSSTYDEGVYENFYEGEWDDIPANPVGEFYIEVDYACKVTITFSLPNTSNFKWADGSTGNKYLYLETYWSVKKSELTHVRQGYNVVIDGNNITSTYYNDVNEEQYAYIRYPHGWGDYGPAYKVTTLRGSKYYNLGDEDIHFEPTDADIYTITFSLSDMDYCCDPNYCKWEDNTTADIVIKWTYNRAVITCGWYGKTTYTYDGLEHGIYVNETTSNGAELSADKLNVRYDGTSYLSGAWGNRTTNSTKPVEAGEYNVYAWMPSEYAKNYTLNSAYESPTYTAATVANSGKTMAFTINRKNISSGVSWSEIAGFVYDNTAKTPEPIVTAVGANEVTSTKAQFTYTYENNINAGENTATVTITGVDAGNYTGTCTLNFSIAKAVLSSVTWINTSLTYTGLEQGPEVSGITLATNSSSASGLVSTGMFEITGWQIDAGTHTATATLTDEYAKNFATSSSDSTSKTFTTSYTIAKALITFTYGETTLTYTGEGQIPSFTLTFPDTVIDSVRPDNDSFKLTVTAQTGSHLTDGEAIDVGGYVVLATLSKDYAKNFTLSASSQSVNSKETEYSIVKALIEINWDWTGAKSYNGLKQGPVVDSFNKPTAGADPFEGLIITYKQNGATLITAPVHVGKYTVTATITNTNYKLGESDETVTETQEFEITAVSYEDVLKELGGELVWETAEGLTFTGEAQGATLPELTGLFADADDSRVLNVKVTYYQNGKVLSGTPVYAGTYVAKAEESFGDYLFKDVTFVIAKRTVTLTWIGDDKSKTDGDKYVWLYDGKEHAPGYEIDFGRIRYEDEEGEEYFEDVKIYRDGDIIETLKLSYTKGKAIGDYTATAAFAVDKSADGVDYNSNFVFAETYKKDYTIEKFIAERVDWYEKDSATALTDSEKASLAYEYTRVYGRDPGLFTAVACATFEADEGAIEISIPLRVIYPDYSEGYWWNGSERVEPYEAYAAYGTSDSANCGFAEELTGEDLFGVTRVFITFKVTDIRSDLIKLTVTWVVRIGVNTYTASELEAYLETLSAEQATKLGVKVAGGKFVFTYDGTSHSPVPLAVDEAGYHVTLHISEDSVKTDAGKYTAYLMPCSAYEISDSDSECAYEIAKREIGLTWTGTDTYEYDGREHLRKAAVTSGSMLAFDIVKVTTDGADVGVHTLKACVTDSFGNVNDNYIITENATSTLTITKKKVVLLDRYWAGDDDSTQATDSNGKTYYIWTYDGKEHAPTATLPVNVYVNGVYTEVMLNVRIVGATSSTGEHYAYAMLDGRDDYNKNFMLVVSENDSTPTVPTCKFEIVRITIVTITWTKDGVWLVGNEEITFEYDGIAHKPGAIGWTRVNGEEELQPVDLTVWGEETNAGTYRAYVSDNYAFDGIERFREFIIKPKAVSVMWSKGDYTDEDGVYTYNGLEQHPNAIVGGGLTSADYYVTGYVNAGSHIAELVFTNKNYTYDDKSSNICDFVIEKQKVAIAWTATGNYTPEDAESGVLYWSYNGTLRGPDADAGDVAIIVTGKETDAGRYVVTATLDGTVAENANYELTNVTKTYVITAYEISVGWTGNADGTFVWEYDGKEHAPEAKYLDWNNEEQPLNVTGARVSAGNGYVATAELPSGNYVFTTYANGKSSGERTFDIKKKTITLINWYVSDDENAEAITEAGYSYEYDGKSHVPAAYVDGLTGDIAKLIVTGARVSAGSGYIATAALRDASNYELGADVNKTYEFGITEKTVWIKWIGVDGGNGFTWQYTGSLICPTAVLADADGKVIEVDGAPISVTITGGKISAGDYTATAHDTFTNYKFATLAQGNNLTHPFKIEAASLSHSFVWTATVTPVNDGTYDVYTYTYTGKAQQPLATCDNADIVFAYSIVDSNNKPVNAIINAGTYLITVTPSDASYVLDNATVKVVIDQITVKAVWSNVLADGTLVDLPYGVKLPTAYYKDVYGRTVALAVSDNGDGTAEATFGAKDNKYGNYVLKADTTTQAFNISAKTTVDVEWDNDNGYWKEKDTNNPVTVATVASFVSAAAEEPAAMPVEAQSAVTSTISAVRAIAGTEVIAAETTVSGNSTATAALNPEKQHIKLEKKKLSAAAILNED